MKTRLYLFVLILSLACSGTISAYAGTERSKEQIETRVGEIKQRVEQIQAMDLKHLDKTQRTSLKHELKDMKSELRAMGPVAIVLSMGVLIVIIVLVILFI